MRYRGANLRHNPITEDRIVGLLLKAVWARGDAGEALQARHIALKQISSAKPSELPIIKRAFKKAIKTSEDQAGALEKLKNIWKEFSTTPFEEISNIASKTKKVEFEIPPWQTDFRATYNYVNEAAGFYNINFCLREIYKKSLKLGGSLHRTTFWAFDGAFSRGVFTAFCSKAVLGFGAEAMEKWNSMGANPYATKAVFATFDNIPNKILLVRLLGQNESKEIWFEHDSFNSNPWNDQKFSRNIIKLVEMAENAQKSISPETKVPKTRVSRGRCEVCGKDSRGKDLCRKHYYQSIGKDYIKICQHPGCEEPSRGQKYCRKHYYGNRRYV